MTSAIDERVVGMRFDNKQFEKGVAETSKSLAVLKQGLNLDAAKASLAGITAQANRFSLAGIESGVDALGAKFSALGVIGVTALATIANRAVNAGLQLVQSLTIGPIGEGFDDYNRKLTSVQTIMNATGQSIETVGGYFDQLDVYADKTIYNLSDMTGAFAKFTNAGLSMDVAVPAIKGISNMVALAGQGANEASIAYYNLSQSISGGFLTTTDYKSLNLANVATKEWKDNMIAGAVAAGTLAQNADGAYTIVASGSDKAYDSASLFNEALSEGWASAGVLTSVLGAYGDETTEIGKKALAAAQDVKSLPMMIDTLKAAVGTSWTTTFEILLGDVNESKKLFTDLTNTISGLLQPMADYRNNLLQGWKDMGGRDFLIYAITTAFHALMDILKPIGEAWKEVFPPATSEQLFKMTVAFAEFINTLKPAPQDLENIKKIFLGIFGVLNIGWTILKAVFGIVGKILGALSKLIGPLLGVAAAIAQPGDAMNKFFADGGKFQQWFDTAGDWIVKPIEWLQILAEKVAAWAATLKGLDIGTIWDNIFGGGKAAADGEPMVSLGERIADAWGHVKDAFEAIGRFFEPVISAISSWVKDIAPGVKEGLSNLDFNAVLGAINTGLFAALLLGAKKFLDNFTGMFVSKGPGLKDIIKSIFTELGNTLKVFQAQIKSKTLLTIAIALAVLTASVIALSFIDPIRLTAALTAMTVMFTQLFASMAIFDKVTGTAGFKKMPLVAASMIILGVALLVLTAAVKGLAELDWNELARGLTGVTVLLGEMIAVSKLMSKDVGSMLSMAVGMVAIGLAIKVLASAVADFAALSWEDMVKGLVGVSVTLTALGLFTKYAKVSKGALANSLGLLALGTALKILSSAVAEFGNLDIAVITQGMVAIAAILGMLLLFTKFSGGASVGVTSIAMYILAGALTVMAAAVALFAAMSLENLVKGLLGMAGALAAVTIAMNFMSGNLLGSAVLVIAAAGLLILAQAFQQFASLSWDEIGRGMVALGGSLAILAGAMALMGFPLVMAGSIGILAASVAMMMLAPALKILGSMSWDDIGRGMAVLASALGILALGGILLLPAIPGFLGLGLALVLIGAGALAAGVGILAFAKGIGLLALVGVAGAAGVTALFLAIVSLIPIAIQKLGEGVIAFAGVIASSGPQLVAAFTVLLVSIVTAINNGVPMIVETLVNMLLTLIAGLSAVIPPLIDFAVLFIMTLVNALVVLIPFLVDAGLKMIQGILEGIAANIQGIVEAAGDIIVNFINGIAAKIPDIIDSAINLVISFIEGLAQGIRENTDRMNSAGEDLADAIIDGIISGLANGVNYVIEKAASIANDIFNSAMNALDAHSPSRKFIALGEWSTEGLAIGLDNNAGMAEKSATSAGVGVVSALKDSLQNIGAIASGEMDLDPTIRPILDLSAVKQGASEISGLMGTPGITVDKAYAKAAAMGMGSQTPGPQEALQAAVSGPVHTEVNYNQYNSSPKALSSVDIYRQTRNQIATVKEALKIPDA